MSFTTAMILLGSLGMFLLGIAHLTDGLKGMAGNALRRVLQRFVRGRWSALLSGAWFTAVIQSSSAATLTVIGFVSAGLVTFPQAVSVVMGANLGTTVTSWLVAVFGFKINIQNIALPMVGIGALLYVLAKGRMKSSGLALAGFGLIFVGIDFAQQGMAGVEHARVLERLADEGLIARLVMVGLGIVMTIILQSSSAATATTLVALNGGTITLEQACALVIGQNIGTTFRSALAAIGAGLAVRRTAIAHIGFNILTAILCLLIFPLMLWLSLTIGGWMEDETQVLTLAVFHTLFNVIGVSLFFPWVGQFASLIVRMTGSRVVTAIDRIDQATASSSSSLAIDLAAKAMRETAADQLRSLRSCLRDGSKRSFDGSVLIRLRDYLENLHIDPADNDRELRRRIALWHSLDHLDRFAHSLKKRSPAFPPTGRGEAQLCDEALVETIGWLEDGESFGLHGPSLGEFSRKMAQQRKTQRAKILEKTAAGDISPDEAMSQLGRWFWWDGQLYQIWRAIHWLIEESREGEIPETSNPELRDDGY